MQLGDYARLSVRYFDLIAPCSEERSGSSIRDWNPKIEVDFGRYLCQQLIVMPRTLITYAPRAVFPTGTLSRIRVDIICDQRLSACSLIHDRSTRETRNTSSYIIKHLSHNVTSRCKILRSQLQLILW